MPAIKRRRRRFVSLVVTGILLGVLADAAGGGFFAYEAVKGQAQQLQADLTARLKAGQNELETAKTSLLTANNTRDVSLVTQAKVHFAAARVQFGAASQMADDNQLLRRIETMPSVGTQARAEHSTVDSVAGMGVALSDAGQELADLDGQLIKPPGGQAARTLLTILGETHTSLVQVRANLDLAQTAAAQVDVKVLPTGQRATFLKARGSIASAIAGIAEFDRLAPIITEVLGGNGPRTFLVEQVNPAELRPGGGFIGTFSLLRADHGTLSLIRSGPAESLIVPRPGIGEPGYVDPPGPFREWIPNTSWSFIDSNFFPDFPSNARAAESFAQPRLGTTIDAVISIDYYTVAKMLELTGPLPVPGFPLTVDASNFVPLVVQHDLAGDDIHKAILAAVAGPLMQRISTLPPERWPALLSALNDVATTRHLQVYFNSPPVEAEMNRFGWSGGLNQATTNDYLMEVEANLGGTKANYFVTRHYAVQLTRNGSSLHHTITVYLQDDMPFDYRPGEFYHAYIQFFMGNTAAPATDSLIPGRYSNPAPPAGTNILDGWVPLFHGYGHKGQAQFDYDTPWVADARGEAQIYWQKQPGTLNDGIDIAWNDGNGHTYRVSGDLSQDRIITMAPTGVSITPGHAGTAKLPSLSLG